MGSLYSRAPAKGEEEEERKERGEGEEEGRVVAALISGQRALCAAHVKKARVNAAYGYPEITEDNYQNLRLCLLNGWLYHAQTPGALPLSQLEAASKKVIRSAEERWYCVRKRYNKERVLRQFATWVFQAWVTHDEAAVEAAYDIGDLALNLSENSIQEMRYKLREMYPKEEADWVNRKAGMLLKLGNTCAIFFNNEPKDKDILFSMDVFWQLHETLTGDTSEFGLRTTAVHGERGLYCPPETIKPRLAFLFSYLNDLMEKTKGSFRERLVVAAFFVERFYNVCPLTNMQTTALLCEFFYALILLRFTFYPTNIVYYRDSSRAARDEWNDLVSHFSTNVFDIPIDLLSYMVVANEETASHLIDLCL